MSKYRRYSLTIETWSTAGRFLHDVFETIQSKRGAFYEGVSQEVVESYKKANEMMWDELPNGSKKKLVTKVKIKIPK